MLKCINKFKVDYFINVRILLYREKVLKVMNCDGIRIKIRININYRTEANLEKVKSCRSQILQPNLEILKYTWKQYIIFSKTFNFGLILDLKKSCINSAYSFCIFLIFP